MMAVLCCEELEKTYASCRLRWRRSRAGRGHHGHAHGHPWCHDRVHCDASAVPKTRMPSNVLPFRAARAVPGVAAITVVVAVAVAVTVPTIVLPRRVVAAARARRPATGRRPTRPTLPLTAVEPPRSRRRGAGPLEGCQYRVLAWARQPGSAPQSSGRRHGPCACCAYHGTPRPHRDGPRTPQKQT